ncbi:MAG: tRNA (5-methylaminomethyl-2-thiouridine)(34)-methyltransferase MnmD [Alphaproteobacteria bacterium]|nr:tRNA (5-methylaminomethyl-2-thiouridine)(34)-methyltransferase MnmD [Alphaproteobacteria bacterium]
MPYSTVFGDHYYSKADGRAECNHVFLNGNDLPARWSNAETFTIGELGFGTGLNFLETWRQWRECRPRGGRLNFVSFERFPLTVREMEKALGVWSDLAPFVRKLTEVWPARPDDLASFELGDAVTLDIFFGDVKDRLPQWSGKADAWFLDGFAPARNRHMWSDILMQSVFEHTVARGTFATYTAAGWVRRNLSNAGFVVRKVPGFAGKRDMTRGYRPD